MTRRVKHSDNLVSPRGSRLLTSVGFQLLVVVNATLSVFLLVLLTYDYQQQLDERIQEKRIALDEEAQLLLSAVSEMHHLGLPTVRTYIDDVRTQMQKTHSPEHYIAIDSGSFVVQSSARHRNSHGALEAMRQGASSPDRLGRNGQVELIVGVGRFGHASAYVAEDFSAVRQVVVAETMRRIVGIAVLALVAALVVNLAVSRIVVGPLSQFVETVRQVAAGRLEVKAPSFRTAELKYLSQEINEMTAALDANARESRSQMARAQQIQEHLLPTDVDVPGVIVAHRFRPVDSVGGDYFDVLRLIDGSWLYCVADVAGHGVPAAMTAAMLKTLLTCAVERLRDPAKILRFVNQRLAAAIPPDHFVSMFLMRVDSSQCILDYANAGHESAWLLTANGKLRELASTGLPLGVEANAKWENISLVIAEGDRLLMVSDGIAETCDKSGKLFGRERIGKQLEEVKGTTVEEAADRFDEVLADYQQDSAPPGDDVTLVLVDIVSQGRCEAEVESVQQSSI